MPSSLPPSWRQVGEPTTAGQAQVFQVESTDPNVKGQFALKRLRDPARAERFRREIATMQLLETRGVLGIPPIRETGRSGRRDLPYYVMPWYKRGNLQDLVDAGELMLPERLDLLIEIAQLLAGVHDIAIAHRDLKPDNVLIADDGSPLLADFGLCFVSDPDPQSRLTEDWRGVGPRLYIAPEMEAGANLDGDHRPADCWSFAKLMWVVLSGRSPLSAADQTEPEHRLGVIDPALSNLDALAEKMLQRKPQDRMCDWGVVGTELRRARVDLGGPSVVPLSPVQLADDSVLHAAVRFLNSPTAARERRETARREREIQELADLGSAAHIAATAAARPIIDVLNDQLGGRYFSVGVGGPTLEAIARTGIFDAVSAIAASDKSPTGSEHAVVIWNGQIPGYDIAIQVGLWLLLSESQAYAARVSYLWRPPQRSPQLVVPGDALTEFGTLHQPVRLGLASSRDAITAAAHELIDYADRFTRRVFDIAATGAMLDDESAWRSATPR